MGKIRFAKNQKRKEMSQGVPWLYGDNREKGK
jgi:hypothetical protein